MTAVKNTKSKKASKAPKVAALVAFEDQRDRRRIADARFLAETSQALHDALGILAGQLAEAQRAEAEMARRHGEDSPLTAQARELREARSTRFTLASMTQMELAQAIREEREVLEQGGMRFSSHRATTECLQHVAA